MTRTAGTVLAADDDDDLRSLYRCWLAGAEEVRTAADGAEALDGVDESVDLLLLDREMPRTDGVAVARELDRRDSPPAVVMISGVAPSVGLLDIPVDDYVRKPVTRETVLERSRWARAVAELPGRQRHLLALDRRRRAVETAVREPALAASDSYERAVDRLEAAQADLERARTRVRRELGRSGTDGPSGPADASLRESP